MFNPLNANPTKWPNTLKQFVGNSPTNYLSVFGHFVNLAFKGLTKMYVLIDDKIFASLTGKLVRFKNHYKCL